MKSLNNYIQEALDGSKMKYSGKNSKFVDVIIENNNGEILVLRRANYMKNFKSCWGIVGGAVELKDKNSFEAAIREVKEETSIEIDAALQLKLKQIFTYQYEDGNITDVFHIKFDDIPNIKISREHSKYEWIDFKNEKIDERKWMPEVFSILQKWENITINERLIINKDLKTSYPELVDEIYKKNINWNENGITKIYRKDAIPSSLLRTKLYNIISNSINIEINYNDREQLLTKMVDYIYLKNERCFQFLSGNHPQANKALMNTSIEKVVKKILDECFDIDIIYEDKKHDFIIFGIKGVECQVLSFGSPIMRLTFVSPIPSDEEKNN